MTAAARSALPAPSLAAALDATTPEDLIGAPDRPGLLAAGRAAGVHAFVAELPEGYATPVGSGGVGLSAPQQERLLRAGLLAAGSSGSHLDEHPDVPLPPPDPGLTCVPRLLDPTSMASLLGAQLHAAGTPLVRVHTVRYKPGDNIVVQYDVRTADGWFSAVAYARSRGGLKQKSTDPDNRRLASRVRGLTPAARPISYLPDVEALVQWMPLDIRLPVLADDAERLARRLAKKQIHVDPTTKPELLRYWPRRRAVLRYGPAVLKVYRDQADYRQALGALRAAAAMDRCRTAVFLGRLPGLQATVQQWLPGSPVSMPPHASQQAGRLLADLHAESVDSLTTTPHDLLRKASSRGAFVAHLLPQLARDVHEVASRLRARMPETGPTVVSHGNFHAGQLLADPTGLALIDVDRLCRAAPAYDIASFATHLAFGRPRDAAVVETAIDSLLAGYGAEPPDLDWYIAACLLRRAAVPFRFQDDDWPGAATELVRQAGQALG